MLALAQYTDEIRCHVPLNDPPCAHKKSAKKGWISFSPRLCWGWLTVSESLQSLFSPAQFMHSFLTQCIAEVFQGAYFSGNYGSQLFSAQAHLSFSLIFFPSIQYLLPSRFGQLSSAEET